MRLAAGVAGLVLLAMPRARAQPPGDEKGVVYVNASRSFQPPSFDGSIGVQEGVDADSFSPGNGRAFYGGVAWSW